MMKYIMAAESRRLYDRMSGDKLSEKQKEQMKSLMSDNMKDTELMTALWILSSILKEYYGEKVIIFVDQYDNFFPIIFYFKRILWGKSYHIDRRI